ncbi:MAG: hypothetical protein MUE30_01240 [Spirosomaceae bacterium]|nr:hypothetical protein [Spirosomataceae bacterium]
MKLTAQIAHCSILFLVSYVLQAQRVQIDVWQQGRSFQDSSYYDIMPVAGQYWIGGKYGILKTIDARGNLQNVAYPSAHVDIYKLDHFDDENLIACADKGLIYKHNLRTKAWETVQVAGYEKSCFYNMAVVNDSTAYICGGNSAIAHSQKTVPLGFILKTTDKGRTWKRVFRNIAQMVWCVKYNPHDQKMYALMYTPNRTYLYAEEDSKWRRKQKIGNSIFHEIQFENAQDFVAMGGWIGKKGRLYHNRQQTVFEQSGLIWGRTQNARYELLTACNGQIIVKDKTTARYALHAQKLNDAFSIYEAVFTSDNTAIAIGSAQTILHIRVQDTPNPVADATTINQQK